MLGKLDMNHGPPDPALRVHEERDPGRGLSPTRRAPAASAPTRRRSVLNVDCRAHELDNLYVVDTSFFPSIGAVNPALTAMANALRVGDHLLERLGAASRGARSWRLRPTARRPRVVIVGGGFGGLGRRAQLRRADVDVTLVDRTNHHLSSRCSTRSRRALSSPSECRAPVPRPSSSDRRNMRVLHGGSRRRRPRGAAGHARRGEPLGYD